MKQSDELHLCYLPELNVSNNDAFCDLLYLMFATVNVGQTYTFSCNASNFLHRQWLHSVPPHSPIILNNRSDGLVEINANLDLILRNIQVKNMVL